MNIRIGANPIGWSNDDLTELGGDIPLETCLTQARAAGFEGMELGHKFPREPLALARVLAAHDLTLVSGWYSSALLTRTAEAELRALQPHLDLLKYFNARVLVLAETTRAVHGDRGLPLSHRPLLDAADWQCFSQRLNSLSSLVAEQGISLCYHHHMGTVVQTREDVARLMDAGNADLALLLDTGHAWFAGMDPATLARDYRERIAHVHCKDIRQPVLGRAKADDRSFLDAVVSGVFTVPGDGDIDFAAVFAELKHYSGWLVVEAEQDPAVADPEIYARKGYRNLRALAVNAGWKLARVAHQAGRVIEDRQL